ncbi:MAG TPA: SulP family inorganic anion transporter [Limnochordales bacterium]
MRFFYFFPHRREAVPLGGGLWRRLRGDVMAGLTVALVALPLALAFGIASGAGPAAGLYAAIFAGFATSLFGGSQLNVSGPTGAMTVVLVDIISRHGVEGMLVAGAMAGVMQVLLGLLRLGSFVKFLPYAVIAGFTNGIAVIIFLSQVQEAWREPVIAFATAGMMLVALRYFRRSIPASLWGLAAGILVNELLVHTPAVVGQLPTGLPALALPWPEAGMLGELIMPAITICLLGSIEALLSAEIADVMSGQRHDGNRELIGQGIGNLVSAVVGGVPVTGAIARTAVNVKSGARTRLAGMLHAVFLFVLVYIFGPWASRIPLASLAAILMVTAVRMADLEGLRLVPRARWTYGATLGLTLVLTVVQDLTVAVAAGVALAGVFAIAELAAPQVRPARLDRVGGRQPGPAGVPEPHPDVQVVAVHGPLLFVGVERLRRQLGLLPARVLVLDVSGVPTLDESGALMIGRLAEELHQAGRRLYIAGAGSQPLRMLARIGVLAAVGRRRVTLSLPTAVARASAEARTMAAAAAMAAPAAAAADGHPSYQW